MTTAVLAQDLKFHGVLDYRDQLRLTPDQVTQIDRALSGLKNRTEELRTKKKAGARLVLELTRQEAALEDIRKALQVVANLEVEARLDELATARAVGKILTREQRARWIELQKSP